MTRYLVTGGAGFIGSHIATRLVDDGHAVRVIDNLSTGSRANIAHLAGRIEFLDGDVAEPRSVRLAVEGIDTVFHQAALASVPRSIEDPLRTHTDCVTGTLTLLNAARQAGVRRIVYAASCSAYGDRPEMPKREDQAASPLSPYAAAKLAGEHYLRAFANCYDIETVCLRYFNVFGPRQDPDSPYSAVIPLFVKALLTNERPVIYGDGTQSRDFTYIDNVVEANLQAARVEGISGRVYNVASGRSYSLLDLLVTLSQLLECPCDPDFAPPRPGDVQHSWADVSAAQRDLGYEVKVGFHEGLRRTAESYMAEETFHRTIAVGH
jgi:UDP-N-acetylglucosamine/UDP-N-acetyl-alpha-D-glucosaminouronate 4-epimerase